MNILCRNRQNLYIFYQIVNNSVKRLEKNQNIPTLAAEILNEGTSGSTFDTLLGTGIQMAAASVLSGVCAITGGYTCAMLSAKLGKDMRVAIYEKSLKLSMYDFRQFGTASITTRTVSDITTIQFAVTSCIQMILPVPVIFVIALALAFTLAQLSSVKK